MLQSNFSMWVMRLNWCERWRTARRTTSPALNLLRLGSIMGWMCTTTKKLQLFGNSGWLTDVAQAECPSILRLTGGSSSMAAALPPGAGSGQRLSLMQPKLAVCSQRLEANAEKHSFLKKNVWLFFRWAITQQHLGKGTLREAARLNQGWHMNTSPPFPPPPLYGIKTRRVFRFDLLIQ